MEKNNNESAQKNQNKSNFRKRLVPGIALIVLVVILFQIPFVCFILVLAGLVILFLIGGGLEIDENDKRIDTKKKDIVQKVFSFHFCLSLVLLDFLGLGFFGGNGQHWFLSTVIIVGIGVDLPAYSIGNLWKRFGKVHKLAPIISPGKTWEGAIFSFITAPILSWLLGTKILSLDCYTAIGLGLAIALFATLGDLFESYYKRIMGIKDSGTFFRGHGGILDRIDSHIGVSYVVVGIRILVSLFL